MRPFRRHPHSRRPDTGAVVRGAQPLVPEEPALFAGEPGPSPSAQSMPDEPEVAVDLVAGPAGMVVGDFWSRAVGCARGRRPLHRTLVLLLPVVIKV